MINDQKNSIPTGFILINKPAKVSSHDVVDQLRKITGIKKIGHAGTLDPFATGLLIMAIGRESTKKISHFVKQNKSYAAKLFLGSTTNTYDNEGLISKKDNFEIPDEESVKNVLKEFVGEQEQIPPMFSAKKVGGKKLYDLARKGIEIKREACFINIYNIEFINYNWPFLEISVTCSTGTYIRSLANDIGKKLGCGAYLERLERTAIENFEIKNAYDIIDINKDNWGDLLFQINN